MKRMTGASLVLFLLGLVSVLISSGRAGVERSAIAQGRPAAREVPQFKVDPTWPKVPTQWILGIVSSSAVDSEDNVWVLQRPLTLAADEKPKAAPPLLEFDAAGNFIQAWGGPGEGYDWPKTEHGVYVDPRGFVWIGGSGGGDNQLLKFTKAGKFVMQIGHAGQSKGNADTKNLNEPADVFVYQKTNELFVADGYANKRLIVFDADTGAFKRMWGAFGNVPKDDPPPPAGAEGRGRGRGRGRGGDGDAGDGGPAVPDRGPDGPSQFVNPVHAVKVSNDGLVYVADRGGRRVQVFTLDGKYQRQLWIGRECHAPDCGNGQTAAGVAFSPDAEQRFLYVADRSQAQVMIFERKTLEFLDSFGQWGSAPGQFGTLHHLSIDSKGNLYTAEVTPLKPVNRRVQKFAFTGMATIAPVR
jgi:DNA-binding beta-propeller fold protein YncE